MPSRKVYPADVTDQEWELVVLYPTWMREEAPQRLHALRDGFDATRWLGQGGGPVAAVLPGHFPPWNVVETPSKRWRRAKAFAARCHDLRLIVRVLHEREEPTAAVFDGRPLAKQPGERRESR